MIGVVVNGAMIVLWLVLASTSSLAEYGYAIAINAVFLVVCAFIEVAR